MIFVACMNKFKQFSAIACIFTRWFLSPVWLAVMEGMQKQTSEYFMKDYAVIASQQGAFVLCSGQLF